MKPLISPESAAKLIRLSLPSIATVKRPLSQCVGRILHQKIFSDRPFPPFDRSMMDGYALRIADISTGNIFTITTQAPAGIPEQPLNETHRSCAEIMTGAVVPANADCVVPYEETERVDEKTMRLLEPEQHTNGACIHKYASDRPAGEHLLQRGMQIGSREIAVAATCGHAELTVSEMPTIAIVSTGDELVEIHNLPESHQIRRSNDVMVEAALASCHLHTQQRQHLTDDALLSKQKLSQMIATNQIVLISGGISMGKKDFIPGVLNELGLKNHFHGIAQKPGKPMGYWTHTNCAVFTLPGNPLSTLTCLHHYVIPAIYLAMGQLKKKSAQSVQIDRNIRARNDFTIFLPVSVGDESQATPQPVQNSGDLVRILSSDGYIVVPPTMTKEYLAGTRFDYHRWH